MRHSGLLTLVIEDTARVKTEGMTQIIMEVGYSSKSAINTLAQNMKELCEVISKLSDD